MRGHRKFIAYVLGLVACVVLALAGKLDGPAASLIGMLLAGFGLANVAAKGKVQGTDTRKLRSTEKKLLSAAKGEEA